MICMEENAKETGRGKQKFAELLCDFMFKRLFGSEANKDVLLEFLISGKGLSTTRPIPSTNRRAMPGTLSSRRRLQGRRMPSLIGTTISSRSLWLLS